METNKFINDLTEALSNIFLGERIPFDITIANSCEGNNIIIPAKKKIVKPMLKKLAKFHDNYDVPPSPIRNKIREIISLLKDKY